MRPWETRRLAPHFLLGGGTLVWVALALLKAAGFPLLAHLEGAFLDGAFRARYDRGRAPARDPRLAMVGITRSDIATVGKWPWPRGTVAKVLSRGAARHQPRGAILDILFRGPSEPDEDAALAAALGAQPGLVLALGASARQDPPKPLGHQVVLDALPDFARFLRPVPPDLGVDLPRLTRLSTPHDPLLAAAGGAGHIFGRPDPDRVYRRAYPFLRMGDHLVPSLALVGACRLLKLPLEKTSIQGEHLVLEAGGELAETRRFRLAPDGSLAIAGPGPTGPSPSSASSTSRTRSRAWPIACGWSA